MLQAALRILQRLLEVVVAERIVVRSPRGDGRSLKVTPILSIRFPSTSRTSNRTPFPGDVVTRLGQPPELPEDVAADGVEVLVRARAEALVESIGNIPLRVRVVVDLLDLDLGDVELVLDRRRRSPRSDPRA